MHALIVFAHHNPKSLNGRLKDQAVEVLIQTGYEVIVSDLFAMKFKALADANDFTYLSEPDYFDLQKEQRYAAQHHTFTPDIVAEQEKLRKADLVVFQFPFWWYSMPAVLKGYIDRVFSVGFAYGGARELAGKKAIFCTTTGSPIHFFTIENGPGPIEQILHHILYGTFAFCDMIVLKPFIVDSAKRLNEAEKVAKIEAWGNVLLNIDQRARVF